MRTMIIPLLLVVLVFAACGGVKEAADAANIKDSGSTDQEVSDPDQSVAVDQTAADKAAAAFALSSPSVAEGKEIPAKFTCDGADVSPELKWTTPPAGTKSLALIMDDPDAPGGNWTHWVVWDIKPDKQGLPENVARTTQVKDLCLQGTNSFTKIGYGGPCPPAGPAHRYQFKLYALSQVIAIKGTPGKAELEFAIKGKILAQSMLTGKYLRPK